MKRFVLTAGLTCALAVPATVAAQAGRPSTPSPAPSHPSSALGASDKAFVMEAARGGLAEVELGRLAVEKASNADVKQFGQRMVDDHGKANDELKGR